MRIQLNLIEATSNRIVWGTSRDGNADALPQVASSLSLQVAAQLGGITPRVYEHFMYDLGGPRTAASPEMAEALGFARRFEPAMVGATERLLKRFPDEPQARVLGAFARLYVAMERSPDSPERRQFDEALRSIDQVDPANPWIEALRANMLRFDGRFTEAIQLYSEVLARNDLSPAAQGLLLGLRAHSYLLSGQSEAAHADLREAVRRDPLDDVTLSVLSNTLLNDGRIDEAIDRARQAVAINPTSWQNYLSLGFALERAGKWQEAAEAWGASCAARPLQVACAHNALSLLKAGQKLRARDAAAAALGLEDRPRGLHQLAMYEALLGERDEALRLLGRAVELGLNPHEFDPDRPEFALLRADPRFESLVAKAGKNTALPSR